jgi:hypothetical protein
MAKSIGRPLVNFNVKVASPSPDHFHEDMNYAAKLVGWSPDQRPAPAPQARDPPLTKEQRKAIRVVKALGKIKPKLKYLAARTEAKAEGVSARNFSWAAKVTGVFKR